MSQTVRLSKLMSQRHICSRREADRYIEQGRIQVDGKRITRLGTKVDPHCVITLDKGGDKPLTILLHKPIGYVSTQPEKGYSAAIELIRPENSIDPLPPQIPRFKMLSCAGRLDIDSKGLLVLTQDGVIAKQLIGANGSVEKEYLVRVRGRIEASKISRLRFGLSLEGKPLKPAVITPLQPDRLTFILKEGKKRQIRRMCQAVDLHVIELKRVRIGKVTLAHLPEGKWRLLKPEECF